MSSTFETGHVKNQTTFFALKTFCLGYGTTYAPANPQLTIPALTISNASAKTAIDQVNLQKVPFNNIQGERALTFKPVKYLSTRIIASLKSVNAPEATIRHAEQINRKIQGTRAPGTPKPTSSETNPTAKDPVSTSQQSYDLKLDYFKKLVKLLTAEPLYDPNEPDLKVAHLLALIVILEAANQAVITAYVPYSNAIIARDTLLYAPQTGLLDIAQDVKNYIKSAFGYKSPQYIQIRGLKFRYPSRRNKK